MSGEVLCVLRGPWVVLREVDEGERWCFGCRKRLPHTGRVLAYPLPESDEDLYRYPPLDPIYVRECSRCKKDRTDFPGSVW